MKLLIKLGIVLYISIALWGCGKGNSAAAPSIDPATNKHQVGWAVVDQTGFPPHASAVNGYFANPAGCVGCHGDKLDGGISKVSCFNKTAGCHINIPFPHPDGYAAFTQHGADAKKNATVGKYNGMANCKNCHGKNYRGVASSGADCVGCHRLTNPGTNAPHAGNWSGGNANGLQHSNTSPDIDTNAPACNDCHALGNNSTRKPSGPPIGPLGCFTNTLCHDANVGHSDPNWKTGAIHGASAKKQDPVANPVKSSDKGFRNCAQCHANGATPPRFSGGLRTACEKCHNQPGLAHPQTWLAGRGTTAGVTNVASSHAKGVAPNYSACTLCHGLTLTGQSANGITYPSCLGGGTGKAKDGVTVCHFTAPVNVNGTFADVGCKSCHFTPGGTYYPPSLTHTKHLALTGISCDTCHFTAGNGGAAHADGTLNVPPPVNLSVVYNAKSGTAVFNGTATGTCSKVSCHGGQTTQLTWTNPGAGVIYNPLDSFSCLNCHQSATGAATPQFNDYFSGAVSGQGDKLHDAHNGGSIIGGTVACIWCHDTGALSVNHFTTLNTSTMEGPASGTIGGGNTSIITYAPATGECFTRNQTGIGAPSPCHNNGLDNFAVPNVNNRRWF